MYDYDLPVHVPLTVKYDLYTTTSTLNFINNFLDYLYGRHAQQLQYINAMRAL